MRIRVQSHRCIRSFSEVCKRQLSDITTQEHRSDMRSCHHPTPSFCLVGRRVLIVSRISSAGSLPRRPRQLPVDREMAFLSPRAAIWGARRQYSAVLR